MKIKDTSTKGENCNINLTGSDFNLLLLFSEYNYNEIEGGIEMEEQKNIPDEYKPISMWGYFGYEILFSIPIIGFIFILVFSFGGTNNINLRNFARSYFCVLIILLIIVGFFALFTGAILSSKALQTIIY